MTLEPEKRAFPCWISAFEEATCQFGVPKSFLRWAAIHTLATALGRKVYVRNDRGVVFPNLYIVLLALPAVGKSLVMNLVTPFHRELKIKVAPQHISKASLVDELSESSYFVVTGGADTFSHAVIVSPEFVETFPSYDLHLLGTLSSWWDCPSHMGERKRHMQGQKIDITNICCNIFTGLQPSVLANTFPPEAWSGGFLSRTIIVYAPEKIEILLRGGRKSYGKIHPPTQALLIKELKKFASLVGQMEEDESFTEEYLNWKKSGMLPMPAHPKLTHYNARREHQLEKLSVISAVSRSSMVLEGQDYLRARQWLEEVEENVDDIFVELASGDEMGVMKDFHTFLLRREGATRETLVRRYLTGRVPSQRVDGFLDHAEKAGFIRIIHKRTGGRFIEAEVLEEINLDAAGV